LRHELRDGSDEIPTSALFDGGIQIANNRTSSRRKYRFGGNGAGAFDT
jgi:hypothetical protein